ncbi:MAG TPA: DegV family protein [Acidimicrobiales bacterium]|nr:DegV family protein [Acidimicrobiales bacterium]
MAGVQIVTDSASDLPKELSERAGIRTVPLEVRLGDHDPAELAELPGEEFWKLANATDSLAETAAPSPGLFAEAFRAAAADGASGVLCVTISSRLSATFQAARAGATEVAAEIPVSVVDSRLATMGEGLLVLHASALAAEGADLGALVGATERAVESISVFGTLENLETLRRGGRIGSAQALIGSLLSIKPVIEVRDGAVEGESKQRTRARSLRYLVDKAAAAGPLAALAVVHAAAGDLDEILDPLAEVFPRADTIVTAIGPVIGAHTGSGTIGLCYRRA